jgi:hypothetical protein
VNFQLKKEAEFFGDIVFVPFLDNYDLVVLKTLAILEYGVRKNNFLFELILFFKCNTCYLFSDNDG